jgi:hypothetical protein
MRWFSPKNFVSGVEDVDKHALMKFQQHRSVLHLVVKSFVEVQLVVLPFLESQKIQCLFQLREEKRREEKKIRCCSKMVENSVKV